MNVSFGEISCCPETLNDQCTPLHYSAQTFGGSSGGPVIDYASGSLVAIHAWGMPKRRSYCRENHKIYGGESIYDIVQDCLRQCQEKKPCLTHLEENCLVCCERCIVEAYTSLGNNKNLEATKWMRRAANRTPEDINEESCPHYEACPLARFGCNQMIHCDTTYDRNIHPYHVQLAINYADASDVLADTTINGTFSSKTFAEHKKPFDTPGTGIMYYLATSDGTYKNPAASGIVKASCSHPHEDSDQDHNNWLNSSHFANFYPYCSSAEGTPPDAESYYCVDFGDSRRVVPTHYSLKHGFGWSRNSLRSWVFEGSTDNNEWVEISKHSNDITLNSSFAEGHWIVDKVPKYGMRYLRIRQVGDNSSGNRRIALKGFEVYGRIHEYN